jgi:protein TonB
MARSGGRAGRGGRRLSRRAIGLVQPRGVPESFLSTIAKTIPSEKRGDEPTLGCSPSLVEFAEPARIDIDRAGEKPSEEELPAASVRLRPRSPIASFAIHLLVLLAIVGWPSVSMQIQPPPIPVQLVLEEPPSAPKMEAPPEPPSPGLLASEDLGDPSAPPKSGAGAPAATVAPTRSRAEAATPPQPPPEPKPAKERIAAHEPAPKPPPPTPPAPAPPKPAPTSAAPYIENTPNEATRHAKYPGPSASRDEYLAYLLQMTKQHLDLLPLSFIGGRQGETVLSIVVLDDGTIARIAVAQSSGFPDIDVRVEQVVAAVGRFPPLPQRYQGPSVELKLRLRFPEAMEP